MKKKKKSDLLSKIGLAIIIIIALFGVAVYWYYSQLRRNDYYIAYFPAYFYQPNPLDGEYTIGGERFLLSNGKAEKDVNSEKVNVDIVGKVISGDINGDSANDSVFLARYSSGSKASYYIVSAIRKDNKYSPLNSVFIGDDITQTELSFAGNTIIERYYEKDSTDEKIVYLQYLDGEIKQLIK
ncbi:MAG: hypothetical protein WCX74_02935 [Candidatus Paceibacterota bacterium]